MPEESAQPLIEADVVGRLMGQPLLARFPMEGSVSGHHRSPHRGSSVEFAEYRNYKNTNFGCLRVMNDDLVQGNRGFACTGTAMSRLSRTLSTAC